MDKYKNKYRIQSHRMPKWDYSGNGIYFITIVTQNRECHLGQIIDSHIELSDFGKIVDAQWLKSFEIRNELFLDEYIIMPNHLHAIVHIETDENHIVGTHDTHVETHGRASLQQNEKPPFIRKPNSISSFIACFKSSVNTKIDDFIDEHHLDIAKYNRNNHFFQPNYHDHIVRNNKEYQRIKDYIVSNPIRWDEDKFNPSNLLES